MLIKILHSNNKNVKLEQKLVGCSLAPRNHSPTQTNSKLGQLVHIDLNCVEI